jgi:hypothetical protein
MKPCGEVLRSRRECGDSHKTTIEVSVSLSNEHPARAPAQYPFAYGGKQLTWKAVWFVRERLGDPQGKTVFSSSISNRGVPRKAPDSSRPGER